MEARNEGDKMLEKENLVKKFEFGLSVLASYINLNGECNLHDVNIIAEGFVGDLLRILYGWDLEDANGERKNNPGYDLISQNEKIIVQVTSTDKSGKIIKMLKTLENMEIDLSGYTLYVVILKEKQEKTTQYKGRQQIGYTCAKGIIFDQQKNIFDFSTFVRKVESLSEVSDAKKIDLLKEFMTKKRILFGNFIPNMAIKNNVDRVIEEYSQNFTEKLFRHKYIENSKVTLEAVFVQPQIVNEDRNLISILGEFLWNETETRILFIEGDAACGKTSFISYLCYHYQKKDDEGKGIFLQGKLICIRLKDLEISEGNNAVEKAVTNYLGLSNFDEYRASFDNHVVILEGADELNMLEGHGKDYLEDVLLAIRRTFSRNKIIVTTRPHYINFEKFSSRNFKIKVVEMKHFDEKMRKEWIEKYEMCGESISPKTKAYIRNLDENRAAGVADTPMALYLLAACEMREELEGNVWALYHEIFTKAIIDTDYNENFHGDSKHPMEGKKDIMLEIVRRIAFEIFKKSEKEQYYIRERELQSIVEAFELKKNSAEIEELCKCCVLYAYWKNNHEQGLLEFYHNNIRDYFFCEYFYDRLKMLLVNASKSEKEIEKLLQYVCENISYGRVAGSTWEETYLFLYDKLRHEKEVLISEYGEDEIADNLHNIFAKILWNSTVWQYPYEGKNYQRIKYAVENTLMVIRIWQSALEISVERRKNVFAESREDLFNLVRSNILSDWSMMFQQVISIPNKREIAIGQYCIFKNISFKNKYLESECFEDSCFEETKFEYSFLKETNFRRCKFSKEVSFEGSKLIRVDFSGAILEQVNFSGATLVECCFNDAKIIDGIFEQCIIESCVFNGTERRNVDIGMAKINNNIDNDWKKTP